MTQEKPATYATKPTSGESQVIEQNAGAQTALDTQVGGSHYAKLAIQPVEYIHANGLGYFEGNIVKYVTRWRDKNGIQDLRKLIHYAELLIQLEGDQDVKPKCAMQNRDPRTPNMIEPQQSTLAERAVAFGYVPFPGEMRPVSGLVDCLMRGGVRMIDQADKIDWFVDENTPMETDVIGWKRAQAGADVAFDGEHRMDAIATNGGDGAHYPPSWDAAPVSASHLLRERSSGVYAWGFECAGCFHEAMDGIRAPILLEDLWEVIDSRPLPSLNV